MSNIRIKELASAEAELGNFDEFEFVADVPDVEASMKISGKQLRESITPSDHTHPIRDVQGLQDELNKKLNKSGGAISGDFAVLGNTRLRNLMIEEFLEVPEFRYNRIETVVGDKWCAAGAGIIEAVNIDDCTLSIKLESGEISSLRANDLCKGIFYNIAVNNHTEETIDSDDSFGHITHAGFTTVYFKLVECLNTNNYGEWRYELREGFPYHPQTAMNIVAYGNTTDTSRQTSRYETRTYQRFLVGMNDWDIKTENIAAQFGDLSNLLAHGLDMKGYSAYLKNIYLQGFISDLLGDSWFDSQSGNMQLYNRSTGCGISFKNGVLRLGRIDPSKPNEGTDLESLLEDLQEARDTLQKINSDEYVSPVEKTYLKERLSDIHSEYSHLLDQATEYILKQGARVVGDGVRIANGVQRRVVLSDEKWTAYVSAYHLAVATLEKYIVADPEHIPIEKDFANIDNYYTARAAVETLMQEKIKESLKQDDGQADLEYLRENFAKSTTDLDSQSGVVLSGFVGVKDESDTKVVAGMAGCNLPNAKDSVHGKLMFFAGANGIANAKSAAARIYEDGHVEFGSGVFSGYTRIPFKMLDEAGTIFDRTTNEYTLNKNLNIDASIGVGAYCVVINLPSDAKYVGSVVNIFNEVVRTKSSYSVILKAPDSGILSDLAIIDMYGFNPIQAIYWYGGLVQLLGVPCGMNGCYWMITYKMVCYIDKYEY